MQILDQLWFNDSTSCFPVNLCCWFSSISVFPSVCGEQLLTDALLQVNPIYLSQVQLQWRQQQQQQANMLALQKAHAAGGAPAAAATGHPPRTFAATPTPAAATAAPATAPAAASPAAAPPAAAAAATASPQSESDSESDSGRAAARAKQQKRKPKNHPRPALSAYKCFVRHLKSTAAGGAGAPADGSSATLLQNLTALAESQGKSVNKLMSEKWRAMSKDNRQHFEDEALGEKTRFDTQMAKWNAKHGHAEAQAATQPARPTAAAAVPATADDAPDAHHDQEMADAEQHQAVAAAAAAAGAAALPSVPAAAAAAVAKPGEAPAVLSPAPAAAAAAMPAAMAGMHPYSAHLMGGGALKAGVVAGPSQAIVHASLPHPGHAHPHPHLMPGLYPPAAFHSPAFQHYITHALQQQAAAAAHREQLMQAQAQQQQQQPPASQQAMSVSAEMASHDAPLPSLPVAEEPPHVPEPVMSVEAASVAAAAADASRAGEMGLA